jgi:hypothetical protein
MRFSNDKPLGMFSCNAGILPTLPGNAAETAA